MKKLVLGLMALVLFAGACHFEHNYTRHDCEVTHKNDCIIEVVDKCGESWSWQAETEEEIELYRSLELGDNVDIKMHDAFTSAYIGDDVIKKMIKK